MAATTLYQAHGGHIDFKAYGSLYNKTFDKIAKRRDQSPRELSRFFSERSTNLETYKEGEVSSVLEVPQKNEDTDRIPLLNPVEGFSKTWTNVQRRSGFIVTRRAVSAQKTRMISKMLTGLPNSAARLEEMAMADLFNNGFATETSGDGTFIFADDHIYEDPQHGTWSNEAASGGGFTTSSYFTAWLNLMQRKNERGFPDPMTPAEVLYPVAMQESVSKVHNSIQYPQNSLNAKMDKLFSSFEMVPSVWLTSATQWFVHAKTDDADKGMVIVWETKPNYASISDSMNPELVMGRRLLMSFDVGALHGRDWYANVGS